jgi:hypothetical protein
MESHDWETPAPQNPRLPVSQPIDADAAVIVNTEKTECP